MSCTRASTGCLLGTATPGDTAHTEPLCWRHLAWEFELICQPGCPWGAGKTAVPPAGLCHAVEARQCACACDPARKPLQVGPESVGASEGFLGWIAYLGAANAGIPLSIIVKNYGWEVRCFFPKTFTLVLNPTFPAYLCPIIVKNYGWEVLCLGLGVNPEAIGFQCCFPQPASIAGHDMCTCIAPPQDAHVTLHWPRCYHAAHNPCICL